MYSNSMWLRRTGGPCNSRQFDKAFRIFEGHFYESRVSWSMQKRPSQLMYFSDFSGLNLESGVSRLLLLWRQSRVAASRKVFEDEKKKKGKENNRIPRLNWSSHRSDIKLVLKLNNYTPQVHLLCRYRYESLTFNRSTDKMPPEEKTRIENKWYSEILNSELFI